MTKNREKTIGEVFFGDEFNRLTESEKYRIILSLSSSDPRLKKVVANGYYEMVIELEKWIREDFKSGHLVEAYALTDQYVQTAIKLAFPQVFFKKRISVESFLESIKKDSGFPFKYAIFEEYRDFKSTRDDLVHKSLFSTKRAKQLFAQKKIEKMPFKIINKVDNLFLENISRAGAYFIKHKLEMSDFLLVWNRVWKKENKDLKMFLTKCKQIHKKTLKS